MGVRMVPCRNTVTGGEAELPETALQHLPNWQPVDAGSPPAADEPPADPADTPRTRKRRMAAPAAETEGVTGV